MMRILLESVNSWRYDVQQTSWAFKRYNAIRLLYVAGGCGVKLRVDEHKFKFWCAAELYDHA